jgi:hypothetical protein
MSQDVRDMRAGREQVPPLKRERGFTKPLKFSTHRHFTTKKR